MVLRVVYKASSTCFQLAVPSNTTRWYYYEILTQPSAWWRWSTVHITGACALLASWSPVFVRTKSIDVLPAKSKLNFDIKTGPFEVMVRVSCRVYEEAIPNKVLWLWAVNGNVAIGARWVCAVKCLLFTMYWMVGRAKSLYSLVALIGYIAFSVYIRPANASKSGSP